METDIATIERVHALLSSVPGISVAGAARELGLDAATVDHHLRRLKRLGRASSVPVGREHCWYASGCGLCPLLQRAIPALRRPAAAALARELSEHGEPLPRVAQRAGVDVGQMRWASGVLIGVRLADRTRAGYLHLSPGADVCVAKALAAERCDRWGACAPSRAWEPVPTPRAR